MDAIEVRGLARRYGALLAEVRHRLLHHVSHLGGIAVHVDPVGQGGEHHHRIGEHAQDGLPTHVHD